MTTKETLKELKKELNKIKNSKRQSKAYVNDGLKAMRLAYYTIYRNGNVEGFFKFAKRYVKWI